MLVRRVLPPVVPGTVWRAAQPAVHDVLRVPDGGEVCQAVHSVTVGVAGPGDEEEPGLLTEAAPLTLRTDSHILLTVRPRLCGEPRL